MLRVIDVRSASLARLAGTDLGHALRRDEIPTVVVTVQPYDDFPLFPWVAPVRETVVPSRVVPFLSPAPTTGTWRFSLGLALRCWSHETGRH